MKILGIDYGKRKIGLAMADGPLAEPYRVIRVDSGDEAIVKISRIVNSEKIEKIVVGISEGKMGEETKNFTARLAKSINIPTITADETLSTVAARDLSIEAGMKRSKRKSMEDAFAASVMLQLFIDEMEG